MARGWPARLARTQFGSHQVLPLVCLSGWEGQGERRPPRDQVRVFHSKCLQRCARFPQVAEAAFCPAQGHVQPATGRELHRTGERAIQRREHHRGQRRRALLHLALLKECLDEDLHREGQGEVQLVLLAQLESARGVAGGDVDGSAAQRGEGAVGQTTGVAHDRATRPGIVEHLLEMLLGRRQVVVVGEHGGRGDGGHRVGALVRDEAAAVQAMPNQANAILRLLTPGHQHLPDQDGQPPTVRASAQCKGRQPGHIFRRHIRLLPPPAEERPGRLRDEHRRLVRIVERLQGAGHDRMGCRHLPLEVQDLGERQRQPKALSLVVDQLEGCAQVLEGRWVARQQLGPAELGEQRTSDLILGRLGKRAAQEDRGTLRRPPRQRRRCRVAQQLHDGGDPGRFGDQQVCADLHRVAALRS